jgi:hypothetical protein
MAKNKLDIERLVSWALREELPKRDCAGHDYRPTPLASWLDMGTKIDSRPEEPGFATDEPPHDDALHVLAAIRQLPDETIDLARARALMGEFGPWLARPRSEREIRLLLSFQTSALVMLHAQLGSRPPWDVGAIRPARIIGGNNRPVVVGITPGGRYGDGAYCPLQLNIDPRLIANARGEYAAWRAGLVLVRERLERWGKLVDHEPTGPAAVADPWNGEPPKPTIWRGKRAA